MKDLLVRNTRFRLTQNDSQIWHDQQTVADVSKNYLKHGVPSVQLKYDTADTPYVTGIRPAKLCNTAKQSDAVNKKIL